MIIFGFLNFVLFVTFVVQCPAGFWLRLRCVSFVVITIRH